MVWILFTRVDSSDEVVEVYSNKPSAQAALALVSKIYPNSGNFRIQAFNVKE